MSTKADRFWLRMIELYGSRWTSNYGSEPSELWASMIDALHTWQIKHAIHALMQSAEGWPPTLPQFRKLAQGAPRPPDLTRPAIGHEKRSYTAAEVAANRKRLADLMTRAQSGEFAGMNEAEIREKLGREQ